MLLRLRQHCQSILLYPRRPPQEDFFLRLPRPCMGRDFRYRGTTLRPGNFDIPSTVDVAILQRPARITSRLPHFKRTQPFRAAGGNAPTNRARLGTVALGNDGHHAACRNRLVRPLRSIERRARTSPSVSWPGSSRSRLRRRSPRNAARDRATPRGGNAVGDFRRQCPCANRLPAPLKHAELFLLLPVESGAAILNPLDSATTLFRPRSMPREGRTATISACRHAV
jgi:hypothetical protein